MNGRHTAIRVEGKGNIFFFGRPGSPDRRVSPSQERNVGFYKISVCLGIRPSVRWKDTASASPSGCSDRYPTEHDRGEETSSELNFLPTLSEQQHRGVTTTHRKHDESVFTGRAFEFLLGFQDFDLTSPNHSPTHRDQSIDIAGSDRRDVRFRSLGDTKAHRQMLHVRKFWEGQKKLSSPSTVRG